MNRIRTDSFQPSPYRRSPPGQNISTWWRLFCLSRLTPLSKMRPVWVKDFADKRREAVHQRAGDERGEDVHDIVLEGADPRLEGLVVKPWRLGLSENVAQRLRRIPKDVLVLVHAGRDEPR